MKKKRVRFRQQEEKDAEKDRRKGRDSSRVSFLSERERETAKEQKDEETAGSNSPVSASSQTPDQRRLWERQWTDASKVNSHNLQVNTVTYYTHEQHTDTLNKKHKAR